MPRLVLAAFCERGIIDQTSNHLTIINQMEEVEIARPPERLLLAVGARDGKPPTRSWSVPVRCAFVAVWEREIPGVPEVTVMTVDLVAPGGKAVAEFRAILDMRKTKRSRHIAVLPQLPVMGEGTYLFRVRARSGAKWRQYQTVTFYVKYRAVKRTR
jgi:hypothetical protein